jgi:hypothetical protein
VIAVVRRPAMVAAVLLVVLAAGACAGKGTGSSTAAATPSASAPTTACPVRDVPSGFSLDGAHSGVIDAAQYSPQSGDMQAAMIYDGFQTGVRSVYTSLELPRPAGTDLVIECSSLQFQDSSGAAQFVAAFKALREQAGNMAQSQTPIGSVGETTLQYRESGQGFAGYNITSTNVVEMGSVDGSHFLGVVVAGPSPSPQLAFALLRDMAAP